MVSLEYAQKKAKMRKRIEKVLEHIFDERFEIEYGHIPLPEGRMGNAKGKVTITKEGEAIGEIIYGASLNEMSITHDGGYANIFKLFEKYMEMEEKFRKFLEPGVKEFQKEMKGGG